MPVLFALSLSKYVNSAGTDIGFASLLAVALLAILYFAGARDSRTLRDQLDEAQERIAGLEARVTQLLRQQGSRGGAAATPAPSAPAQAPRVPGVVPAPAPAPAVGPMGSAVARVQRQTGTVTTAGALGLAGAPAGAGAPALGSATTIIPAPGPLPARAPAAVPVGTGATVAAVSSIGYADLEDEADDFDAVSPEDTMFVPASTAAGNGAGTGGGRFARSEDRFDPDDDLAGAPPRRTIPTVPPVTSRPLAARLLGALAAVVVLVVIVIALLAITSSGGPSSAPTLAQTSGRAKPTRTVAPFNPASVKVSVLNGTAVGGLAADIGRDLTVAGFTVPATAVTNAATQTETATIVGYRPGARADAVRVAAAISKATGVTVSTVTPADTAAITACATPTGSGQAGTCPASVIVTIGSDLSGAANSTPAG
ncbi:MAG TPA: LytR C-terminal domain-containing protein [Solirubrobacteraceae bacterium]|nr:LytR C-terminal domain-containing protein [Solirubrobacteraceae bacterium]